MKTRSSTKNFTGQIRRKVLCTRASQSGNENIDLLLASKPLNDLKFLLLPGVTLDAIFSKRSKQKRPYASLDDF